MKKILVVCLLGIGMMLPTLQTTAKEEVKRIVDCTLEDEVLLANSGSEDGAITKIVITNNLRQTVAIQQCGGYHCEMFLGNLPVGSYAAHVYTTRTGVHVTGFSITE